MDYTNFTVLVSLYATLKINCTLKKVKSISIHAWTGPEDSKSLKLPDFKTTAHKFGNVVSPAPPPQKIFLVLISVRGRVDPTTIVNHRNTNLMAPSGIDSATFQLIAQSLNQLHHRVPQNNCIFETQFPQNDVLSRVLQFLSNSH